MYHFDIAENANPDDGFYVNAYRDGRRETIADGVTEPAAQTLHDVLTDLADHLALWGE